MSEGTTIKMGADPDAKENKEDDITPVSEEPSLPVVEGAGGGEASEVGGDESVQTPTSDAPDEEDQSDGIDLKSLAPDLPLWEDGPTAGETLAWKNEYGEVYTTSFTMDHHVMWRPITRPEYRAHVKQMEMISQQIDSQVELNMLQEEILTELCVLHPVFDKNNMAKELAGMPSIIAQQVMEASGFAAIEVRQL